MPPSAPAPSPASGRTPLADEAIDAVLAWYHEAARNLPWRQADRTPWGVLVSEIMLQQTPVVRVLPRWQDWMRRWPEPADLAAAPVAEGLRAWDRLGYPRRALRLHACAQAIVERFEGQVPSAPEELRSLPGIGEYTAAAVGAFAFGERTVVADTNIRRLLARAVSGRQQPAPSFTAAERALVASCVPHDRARSVRWNQATMELGALVCTSRTPHCDACPLAAHGCAYLAAGLPDQPEAKRRVQPFEGTDRQMRGMIMARLRADCAADRALLDALDTADPARVERCLTTLVADGLAVERDGLISLP